MNYVHVVPLFLEVLCDQSAVAMVWFVLAAQEASTIKLISANFLDLAVGHQLPELGFVDIPYPFPFLILVENFLGRSQLWNVTIAHAANRFCEVL